MLSILLALLGSVLLLLTILTAILFMIAGIFRRSRVNIKALVASSIIGLLMIILGVLPLGVTEVAGLVVLVIGGLALFFFIWLRGRREKKLRKQVFRLREYIRRENIRRILRFLVRIGIIVGVILLFNVAVLWVFLFSRGQWNLLIFTELLTILLLLEGALVGVVGAFMFFGYSEYMIARQGAINPAIVGDQRQKWRERRLSQQKWGIRMVIAGVLLILLGLMVSFLTSL